MPNKKQIFCFTYAGGNASFYDQIEKDLPEYDFVKLEYAGHGTRHKEPLCQNFTEVADDLYSMIKELYSGEPYALFGYSMGTISLVEVLKRIMEKKELPLPDHVFLAAHEPITKNGYVNTNESRSDEWIRERTIQFGTVPEVLLNNKSFWRMYLPLYRADYRMIGLYQFENLKLFTRIPADVFYSEEDTRLEDMKLWKNIFIGECSFHEFFGKHFFIQVYHEKMADIIRDKLK